MTARSLARQCLLSTVLWAAVPSGLALGQVDSANEKPGNGPNVEVFVDRGDTFIRAGTTHGVKVGIVLPVLGPPIGNTQERRTIGGATVIEVWETLARVSLDKAASSVAGPKLARIAPPPAPAPEPPPAPALPPPPPPPLPEAAAPALALKGHAEMGAFSRVWIYNDSPAPWSNCELKLPNNTHFKIEALPARSNDKVRMGAFEPAGPVKDVPINSVTVTCDQGVGKFPL